MYSHEYFDDSIFDTEEYLAELEDQNNLYSESSRVSAKELLDQGNKLYRKSIGKWAKWDNDQAGRAFSGYYDADTKYDDYTKYGFQYDPEQRKYDKGKYQSFKAQTESNIQNKLRLAEDEYKSRMRQATTPEERKEAKKQYQIVLMDIRRLEADYKRKASEFKKRGTIIKGHKEQEKEYKDQ